jgi:hypothetical protein
MELKVKNGCPLNNFEPCKQLDCAWFTKLAGKNPQGGKEVEEWGCAITMLPLLMVAQTNAARHTAGAVESFRNVVATQQDELLDLAKAGEVETRLIK